MKPGRPVKPRKKDGELMTAPPSVAARTRPPSRSAVALTSARPNQNAPRRSIRPDRRAVSQPGDAAQARIIAASPIGTLR